MIADLEADWHVTLLTRSRSGIEITSEAMVLIPKIQEICKAYEDLNYTISELHGLRSGSIRVGAFSSIASGLLPELIKSFHSQYPNIDFHLINGEYNPNLKLDSEGGGRLWLVSLPAANDLEATFLLQDQAGCGNAL